MAISGIILAGGKSQRMGRDKALMLFHKETLIEHTVKELKCVADEIIIAVNDPCRYHLPGFVEVSDIFPDMGPLGGIHAGLMAAKNEYTFIVSCDMPLFRSELASHLLARRHGYDAVVPQIYGRWEPLCAVYSRGCLTAVEKCLQSDVRQVFQFYPEVKVLSISELELSSLGKPEELFYNLNTPKDYHDFIHGKT